MKIGKSYNAAKAGGIVAPPPKEVLGHHHAHGLTSSERHFLSLIADGGTI